MEVYSIRIKGEDTDVFFAIPLFTIDALRHDYLLVYINRSNDTLIIL